MYFDCPDGGTNPTVTELLYNKDTAVTTRYELYCWKKKRRNSTTDVL